MVWYRPWGTWNGTKRNRTERNGTDKYVYARSSQVFVGSSQVGMGIAPYARGDTVTR